MRERRDRTDAPPFAHRGLMGPRAYVDIRLSREVFVNSVRIVNQGAGLSSDIVEWDRLGNRHLMVGKGASVVVDIDGVGDVTIKDFTPSRERIERNLTAPKISHAEVYRTDSDGLREQKTEVAPGLPVVFEQFGMIVSYTDTNPRDEWR